MLAAALPVAPTLGLKSSVLAAVGLGGGTAGGLTVAGGGGVMGGVLGGATLAKVAVVGVLAGGVVAGEAVIDSGSREPGRPGHSAAAPGSGGREAARTPPPPRGPPPPARVTRPPEHSAKGVGRFIPSDEGVRPAPPSRGRPPAAMRRPGAPRPIAVSTAAWSRGAGAATSARPPTETGKPGQGRPGRGPIDTPPAQTPVKRGPPPKPEPSNSAPPKTQGNGQTRTQAAPKKAPTGLRPCRRPRRPPTWRFRTRPRRTERRTPASDGR